MSREHLGNLSQAEPLGRIPQGNLPKSAQIRLGMHQPSPHSPDVITAPNFNNMTTNGAVDVEDGPTIAGLSAFRIGLRGPDSRLQIEYGRLADGRSLVGPHPDIVSFGRRVLQFQHVLERFEPEVGEAIEFGNRLDRVTDVFSGALVKIVRFGSPPSALALLAAACGPAQAEERPVEILGGAQEAAQGKEGVEERASEEGAEEELKASPIAQEKAIPTEKPKDTPEPTATVTSSPTPEPTNTPTPEPTDTPVPTPTAEILRPLPEGLIRFDMDETISEEEKSHFIYAMTVAYNCLYREYPDAVGFPFNFMASRDLDKVVNRMLELNFVVDVDQAYHWIHTQRRDHFRIPGNLVIYAADIYWDKPRPEWKSKFDESVDAIIHEFWHQMQFGLSGGGDDVNRPPWMREGQAEFLMKKCADEYGHTRYSWERELKAEFARQVPVPLSFLIPGFGWESNYYHLSFFAGELLYYKYGGLRALATYHAEVGRTRSVPEAFQKAFGIPLEDFYKEFEEWRAKGFPSAEEEELLEKEPFSVTYAQRLPSESFDEVPEDSELFAFKVTGAEAQLEGLSKEELEEVIQCKCPEEFSLVGTYGEDMIVLAVRKTATSNYLLTFKLPNGERKTVYFTPKSAK